MLKNMLKKSKEIHDIADGTRCFQLSCDLNLPGERSVYFLDSKEAIESARQLVITALSLRDHVNRPFSETLSYLSEEQKTHLASLKMEVDSGTVSRNQFLSDASVWRFHDELISSPTFN